MTEYRPDSWVVIKMTHRGEILYKVLGGWAGSYTQGSSWRLNSGVTHVDYDISNDQFCFYGSSGSVYVCNPESYGLKMSTAGIWNEMKNRYPDQVELLDNCDWTKFDFGINDERRNSQTSSC